MAKRVKKSVKLSEKSLATRMANPQARKPWARHGVAYVPPPTLKRDKKEGGG